jgi:RNA polymerase sigma-70 factor (ECF subfamily)
MQVCSGKILVCGLPMTGVDSRTANRYPLPMQPGVEKALVDQARNGQESAFARLVEAHSEKVIQLAWRLIGNRSDAEEISQEAFLRLFRSLPTFRGDSSVGTWLYRTVSRLAIDHLRREKLKRKLFFFRPDDQEQVDPIEMAVDPAASPADLLQARETAHQMQQLLNRLPARQKAVFVLRHMEGLPLKEIAALLNLSEGTVKAHLHRAVSLFRVEFNEAKENVS